jgi:hypothetical protein
MRYCSSVSSTIGFQAQTGWRFTQTQTFTERKKSFIFTLIGARHAFHLDQNTAVITNLVDIYPHRYGIPALFDKGRSSFVDLFSEIDNADELRTRRDLSSDAVDVSLLLPLLHKLCRIGRPLHLA